MAIPPNFVENWEYLHPKDVIEAFSSDVKPKGSHVWVLKNEIRPSDLYCYFWSCFGPPNGIQNFLRGDHSENLIHWDWVFKTEFGLIIFLGMNFRTEVKLQGGYPLKENDKIELVRQIKADFKNYAPKMSEFRNQLEPWIEFVNPYYRLKRSIDTLLTELRSLSLDPEQETIEDFNNAQSIQTLKERWEGAAYRYSKGVGLMFRYSFDAPRFS